MAIDTSLATSGTNTAAYATTPASTAYNAATSGVTSSVSGSGGVVASANKPVAVEEAVQLADDASVVVSLGNAIGSTGLTYNAVGVFDSIVDAGLAGSTAADTTQNQATQSLDQGILGSITSTPTTAGIYNGSGEFSGLDTGFTTQLASLLKSNPDLSDTIVSDVATQGIIGALFSTTA